SSVECIALTEEASWPGALERILNTPDNLRTLGAQRVHVGNIGRSGVSSRELDLILERVLPQYGRLAVIVIMVGGSDIFPWFEKDYTAEEAACFWHGGMGKAWKQTVTTYFSLAVVNQVVHLLDARAARVAEALGIEHRDLRSVLAPSLENYYDYMHYTPAGAAVVAREVAATLLRPYCPEDRATVGGPFSVAARG